MSRPTKEEQALNNQVKTRVSDAKFKELTRLLEKSNYQNMSELVRAILYKQPIRVATYDGSLDKLMPELARIRKELKAIGVNINQITHALNSTQDREQKLFHALGAAEQYGQIGSRVEELLLLISQIAKLWLPK